MGREKVLKKIKNSGIWMTIFGGLFVGFTLLSIIAFAVDGSIEEYIVVMLVVLALGIPMLIFGIRNLTNPMKHGMFKRTPNLLYQVDNMAANKCYEDKFIMISDRCIANKKAYNEIAYLEDVFLVYILKRRTNFIPTGKLLFISTATGDIGINIYGVKKATVDELADKIGKVCPNVRFGYNDEGLAYLRQMKQMYKNNNGMIPYKGFVQNVFGNVQNNYGQGYDQNTFNQ